MGQKRFQVKSFVKFYNICYWLCCRPSDSKTPEPESKTFTDRLKTKYSAALNWMLEYFLFRVFNVWRGRWNAAQLIKLLDVELGTENGEWRTRSYFDVSQLELGCQIRDLIKTDIFQHSSFWNLKFSLSR